MPAHLLPLAFLLPIQAPTSREVVEKSSSTIRAEDLKKTVLHLADRSFKGRRTGSEECLRAAEWIASRMKGIGLRPLMKESWFHEFALQGKKARNVLGLLQADPPSRDYILVGAHHDHLGLRGDRIHPGANDNATGVSAVLGLATELVKKRSLLKRNIVFASFDAEERGMIGSRKFVDNGVLLPEQIDFVLIFDIIGDRFLPWRERELYVMGTEHCRAAAEIVERHRKGRKIHAMGTWVLEPAGPIFARSDYAPFRSRKIPFLFLSTATPWYYHTPEDRPDKIDFDFLADNVRFSLEILLELATSEKELPFVKNPKPRLSDAENMLEVVQDFLERAGDIPLGPRKIKAFEGHREKLQALVESGSIGQRDRRIVQRALVEIFRTLSSRLLNDYAKKLRAGRK